MFTAGPTSESRSPSRKCNRSQAKLRPAVQNALEALEIRRLMSTVVWNVAADGNWSTASNWIDDQNVARVPTSLDDVVINPTGTRTINVDGTQAAKSITMTGDDTLSLVNSTLSLGAASE